MAQKRIRSGLQSPAAFISIVSAAASVAILAAKFVLVARINVNWDEFYFLNHVYALARGELELLMQGAYTHAFLWITSTGGNEVDQVVRLRVVMCVLLAISAVFLWALARTYASRTAAWLALLAFLASWPVLKHGASFRADSIVLPLTLAAFYFALRRGARFARDAAIAGACLGLAITVTVKGVLLVPALVLMAALPDTGSHRVCGDSIQLAVRRIVLMVSVAAAVAATLLLLHGMQVEEAAEPAGGFASRTLQSAFDAPLLPRVETLVGYLANDALYWIAALAGFMVALQRRSFSAAAVILCLAPMLFYRNAFPYYFPVMMAPAAVLVAIAVDWLLGVSNARARPVALATVAVGCLSVLHGAWDGIATLRFDGLSGERAIVAAVHRVFPLPVPYIDHSGMIASFPKANFFMSGWGVEHYLSRGEDFMPEIIRQHCAPLLLVNHSVLKPGALLFRELRATDRALLESRYVPYWGPIRLAGAARKIQPGRDSVIRVPCTGRYRVSTEGSALFDGHAMVDGEVLELEGERDYRVESASAESSPVAITLRWADVGTPPSEPPPRMPVYAPL